MEIKFQSAFLFFVHSFRPEYMNGGNCMNEILSEIFGIWYLIGAAFVFFMQAGFAMVESGFTRIKNAGNILMKNLMDFCLGTVAFFDPWV